MEVQANKNLLNYLEGLLFKDQAYFRLLKFLTLQSNTELSWIEYYTDLYEKNFAELSIAKQAIINTYKPNNKEYNYSIDFETGIIHYDAK